MLCFVKLFTPKNKILEGNKIMRIKIKHKENDKLYRENCIHKNRKRGRIRKHLN